LYEWLKRTIEKIFIGYHQAKLKITDLSSRSYIPLKKLAILNVSYEKIYILTTDPTIITGIQKQSEKMKLKSIQKLSGRYFYKSEKVAAFSSN